MSSKKQIFLLCFASLGLMMSFSGCSQGEHRRADRAAALFGNCTQCHGAEGHGIRDFRTPSIAGLPSWYVEAELMKFRQGARGDDPRDLDGLRMRPMSRVLATDDEVHMVADYVAGLVPLGQRVSYVEGDAHRGREYFQPCVQCHGEGATGNAAMHAPPLVHSDDWYLVAQLRKFKAGIRGADPLDTTGAQMRPMAASLPDEQAVRDVVAYISTLRED